MENQATYRNWKNKKIFSIFQYVIIFSQYPAYIGDIEKNFPILKHHVKPEKGRYF